MITKDIIITLYSSLRVHVPHDRIKKMKRVPENYLAVWSLRLNEIEKSE